MEYVLLLSGDDGACDSAAELGGRTGRLAAWVSQLREAGRVRRAGHIDGPVLRVRTVDGRVAVMDVPPAAKDVRSWLLIEAPDLEEALRVARSCPEAERGDVRVLPVDPEGGLP